ncbi:hypothetical protein PHSC3_001343 [Chlamydiales bacterium STE3]|nr:hypothetical protein PHSC3_001343 [Chlamydiales bacterium STE3]
MEEPRKSAGWNCEKEFYSSGRVTVKALAEEYFEDASGEIEDRQMNFSCQGRLSLNKLIHHP